MKHASASSAPTPVIAVVLAAGAGQRFDPDQPKQLVTIEDKPIVAWSIEAFEHNPHVTDILVVVSDAVHDRVGQLVEDNKYAKVRALLQGGKERSDSTEAALEMLAKADVPDDAKVLIHDSARPFVSQEEIDGCIDALGEFTAATVACPSTDTILLTEDLGDREVVRSVPERRHSFRAQTPQGFRFATIRKAYGLAADDPDFKPTDDTRVVVDYLPDQPVAIVAGSPSNMKVTTKDDLPMARLVAQTVVKRREAKAKVRAIFNQALR